MIVFDDVNKFVLSNLNLHIPKGEMIGVIGPSGAGKTTFLKLASGLLSPDAGSVHVMGMPAGSRIQKKFTSAFFAGIPYLCKENTVRKEFGILRKVYCIGKRQFWKDYGELAEQLDFAAFEEKRITELSLGQKMRTELAAALITHPLLLLLDEPFVGLDMNAKAAFHDILLKESSKGMTVVITSHDMMEISRLCGRLAMLDDGRLLYYGSEERLQEYFMPIHSMRMALYGKYPDLQDLPLTSYLLENNILTLHYNAQYITAAEILRLILSQTEIGEVSICKPDLEKIIAQLKNKEGDTHEPFH